jgi:excisionase family DNA binding protein
MLDDELYTTNEVAEKLKVTPKTIREWIGRGELEAIDLGQGYRIRRSDLDTFLDSRKKRRKNNEEEKKQDG